MALAETAAVIGMAIAVVMIFGTTKPTFYASIAKLGITAAIGACGGVVGYVSYKPAQAAILAITRQPFSTPRILNLMIITISLLQTPIIFGFIISFFVFAQSGNITNITDALRLLGGGLCIGIGTIGPSIGLARFAQAACKSVGINRHAYAQILSFTFLSEAIIETSIIFALLTSMVLIGLPASPDGGLLRGIILLSAALCTGVSTIAPGISSGKVAAVACEQIAYHQSQYNRISHTSMIAQGLLDTCAIYGLLVSLMLIFAT